MVVHIAAIGTETGHVTEWLRSGSVEKIYLLHSRKTAKVDFPKKARDLEKQIKKMYPGVEIIKRVIENAFNLDDTQDAISKIVYSRTNFCSKSCDGYFEYSSNWSPNYRIFRVNVNDCSRYSKSTLYAQSCISSISSSYRFMGDGNPEFSQSRVPLTVPSNLYDDGFFRNIVSTGRITHLVPNLP